LPKAAQDLLEMSAFFYGDRHAQNVTSPFRCGKHRCIVRAR
jgi:hypothetical protein